MKSMCSSLASAGCPALCTVSIQRALVSDPIPKAQAWPWLPSMLLTARGTELSWGPGHSLGVTPVALKLGPWTLL